MAKTRPRLCKRPGRDMYDIAYRCQYGKFTRYVSTGCRFESHARRKLLEFWTLFDAGKIGPDFSFLKQEREEVEAVIHQKIEAKKQQEQYLIENVLPEFEAELSSGEVRKGERKAVREAHVLNCRQRLERLFKTITRIDEITPELVKHRLEKMTVKTRTSTTKKPISATTKRHYETTVKTFTAWLYRTGKLPTDPLMGMKKTHVAKNQIVHARNALTPEEITQIVASVREKRKVKRRFEAEARAIYYEFMFATGFRSAEAAAIRKKDFAPDLSFVHIEPWFAKSGKAEDQPIGKELRPKLQE